MRRGHRKRYDDNRHHEHGGNQRRTPGRQNGCDAGRTRDPAETEHAVELDIIDRPLLRSTMMA